MKILVLTERETPHTRAFLGLLNDRAEVVCYNGQREWNDEGVDLYWSLGIDNTLIAKAIIGLGNAKKGRWIHSVQDLDSPTKIQLEAEREALLGAETLTYSLLSEQARPQFMGRDARFYKMGVPTDRIPARAKGEGTILVPASQDGEENRDLKGKYSAYKESGGSWTLSQVPAWTFPQLTERASLLVVGGRVTREKLELVLEAQAAGLPWIGPADNQLLGLEGGRKASTLVDWCTEVMQLEKRPTWEEVAREGYRDYLINHLWKYQVSATERLLAG